MFDSIITQIVKPKSISWEEPDVLKMDIGDEKGPQPYFLLKGAYEYLHKKIDVKPATSKELYKKAEGLWTQFKNIQLEKCLEDVNEKTRFYLEKDTIVYLINNNFEIVDIIDLQTNDDVEKFKTYLNNYTLNITTTEKTKKFYTDGKGGLIKLVCYDTKYDVTNEPYVPVVILELNNVKSKYEVYTGIFLYKTFSFIPNTDVQISQNKLSKFILSFDINECLKTATENAEGLYEEYNNFKNSGIEVSARELTTLLRKVGYKLELDTADRIYPITNLNDEENNQKIQDFYNTFTFTTGETAYDILQLSDLKKTFRYNEMTLLDVLNILSKEYLTYDGSKITAQILGDIIFALFHTKNTDKAQTELIKKEVQ